MWAVYPKKLFYYGAHFHEDFTDAAGFGWSVPQTKFDWPTLRDNKNAEIKRLNGIYQKLLDNTQVTTIHGRATLTGADTVEVNGQSYTADKILVAVGGRPFIPDFPGKEHVISSDEVFHLETLPKEALVVGGGYIAVEFAGIFNGLGVKTDLVYRGSQLLRHFDYSLGAKLAEEMPKKGIQLMLNTDIESIEPDDNGFKVTFSSSEAKVYQQVLYATGRKAYTDTLGLEALGVERRKNGTIITDDYFQTNVESVFALGDVIGTPELTPVATAQGMAFVDTWFKQQKRTVDYDNIPTAVFCQPNVGTVGLSEEAAKKVFANINIYESEFTHLKHTLSGNSERTYMKLIVDADSDKVLGAHMLGAEAGEIMQGLAIAIKAGATKAVFDATIGIHPTAAEEFVTMREVAR